MSSYNTIISFSRSSHRQKANGMHISLSLVQIGAFSWEHHRQRTSTFIMTPTMVNLRDKKMLQSSPKGLTYLIVQVDIRDLDQKVISTASAVLHAPVQVCLGALHYACVSVTY